MSSTSRRERLVCALQISWVNPATANLVCALAREPGNLLQDQIIRGVLERDIQHGRTARGNVIGDLVACRRLARARCGEHDAHATAVEAAQDAIESREAGAVPHRILARFPPVLIATLYVVEYRR